jgi:hypothetical protein
MALAQGHVAIVEAAGRVTGYAAAIGFRGHALAEDNAQLWALIAQPPAFLGPGFFFPAATPICSAGFCRLPAGSQ